MHKKLLLVMLIPILALGLIVVGCGSDDDLFDGNPTFRGVQGSWHSAWTENPTQWFLVSANQISMMNAVTTEGGLVFRTGFTYLADGNIMDVVPATEIRTINQQLLLEALSERLALWHDVDNPGWWGDERMPAGVTFITTNPVAFGFGPGTVAAPAGLATHLASFVDGLAGPAMWETVNSFNSLMVTYGSRELENFFRNELLGIGFAWRFRNDNLMEVLGAPNNAGARATVGFAAGDMGTFVTDQPVFVNPGTPQPERVVSFRWSLHDWETSDDEGTLEGLWVDWDGEPANQMLVLFSSVHPFYWQDNMPIDIGVFVRGTP